MGISFENIIINRNKIATFINIFCLLKKYSFNITSNVINKSKFNLINLFKEEKSYRFFCYSLVFVIVLNSIFNLVIDSSKNIFNDINFFDLLAGFLLFISLYAIGSSVKYLFKFDSVSLGITFYLFSFFIFVYTFL